MADRACAARLAVSEYGAKLISPRLFELKIGAIGQALGKRLAVSLLIEIENKAMRVQVSGYPFFIESERGQVEVEPLLSIGAILESQLRAIYVEERANDRAVLGGIEEVRGHPQRQIARAHRGE